MPAMFRMGAHTAVGLTANYGVAGGPDGTNSGTANPGDPSPGDWGTDHPCGSIAIQPVHAIHAVHTELVGVHVVMVVVMMMVPVAALPRVHAHGAIHSAVESARHVAGQSVVCVEVVRIIDAVSAVVRPVASVLHRTLTSLLIAAMMATGVVSSAVAASACEGCHRHQEHTSDGCGKHGSGHGVRLSDEELGTA